jgi:hypothetical protein
MTIGQCDCCGKDHRLLHFTVYAGMDTSACAECCNGDVLEDRDDIQFEMNNLIRIAETGEQWARIAELEIAMENTWHYGVNPGRSA